MANARTADADHSLDPQLQPIARRVWVRGGIAKASTNSEVDAFARRGFSNVGSVELFRLELSGFELSGFELCLAAFALAGEIGSDARGDDSKFAFGETVCAEGGVSKFAGADEIGSGARGDEGFKGVTVVSVEQVITIRRGA